MTQSKDELERHYAAPDPWDYTKTPDDIHRRQVILHMLGFFGPFSRALDIGAGEGWITQALPASVKHGFELSDLAAARFPPNVYRACDGQYDLVIATGVLYYQYEWTSFVKLIQDHASDVILTSSIKAWESQEAIAAIPGRQIFALEFPYRVYTQKLRVFKK